MRKYIGFLLSLYTAFYVFDMLILYALSNTRSITTISLGSITLNLTGWYIYVIITIIYIGAVVELFLGVRFIRWIKTLI